MSKDKTNTKAIDNQTPPAGADACQTAKAIDTPPPAKAIDPAALIVSLPQAARMLGVSQSEARRWERLGLMPPLVKLPTRGTGKARRLYYRKADIEAMIDRLTAGAGAGGR